MTGAVGIYTACVCAVTLHVSFSVVGYSVACGWGGARDDWRHLTGHVNESRVYGVRGTYVGGLVRWTVHLLVVILYTVYAPLRQRRWTRGPHRRWKDYWINSTWWFYLTSVFSGARHLRCPGAPPQTPGSALLFRR